MTIEPDSYEKGAADCYQHLILRLKGVDQQDKTDMVVWMFKMEADCDFDCVDNLRIAKVGDNAALKEYRKKRDSGCCGVYDTKVTCTSGAEYLLGCNHGH